MKRFFVLSLFLVLILAITGCGLFTKTGSIAGTITDYITGEGLANVLVTVGGNSVRSDAEGNYNIIKVKVGDYELTAEADNYITYKTDVKIKKDVQTKHNFQMSNSGGIVRGCVTDGRGGSVVSGVSVIYDNNTTETDENGQFEMYVEADSDLDLFVKKDGRATVRVQNINLSQGEILNLEIPTRQVFNPNQLDEPPTISTNIEPDAILSGIIDLELSIDVADESMTYVYYVYLGGEQRYPNNGFDTDESNGIHQIDTTLFANGETYIKILAYDFNHNSALYIFPVTIDNEANDEQLPGDIMKLDAMALTFGTNIVFFGDQFTDLADKQGLEIDAEILDLEESEFNLEAAPAGATVIARLLWEEADHADSYAVYRSFDANNYHLAGTVLLNRFDDFSATLEPNKEVYYKVIPRNSFGEGTPVIRKIIPLPAADVYLVSPVNEAHDVTLSPTFTWRHEFSSAMPDDVLSGSVIEIWDGTDYILSGEEVDDVLEYTYPSQLAPGGIYSWDIVSSTFMKVYEADAKGYSFAISAAGEYTANTAGTGSINGEFIFTTLMDLN